MSRVGSEQEPDLRGRAPRGVFPYASAKEAPPKIPPSLRFLCLVLLAVVLVHAAADPSRVWINLLLVLGLYAVWYGAGELTRLVRPAREGADLGFMTVGGLITFPIGLIAALVVL